MCEREWLGNRLLPPFSCTALALPGFFFLSDSLMKTHTRNVNDGSIK